MEYKQITLKIPVLRWRYFRFSFQSMLLVILAAALSLGWWRDHNKLSQEIDELRYPKKGWDTDQVLGPPDTPLAGDHRSAWASKTADGQSEWLILEYEHAVRPKAVVVHENYKPGALSKVSFFHKNGKEIVVWQGTDPTPASEESGISKIAISTTFETKRVKLYLDSMAVPGWNEVDAVGLQYGKNKTLWAERAFSSSSYGRNNELSTFYSFGGMSFQR